MHTAGPAGGRREPFGPADLPLGNFCSFELPRFATKLEEHMSGTFWQQGDRRTSLLDNDAALETISSVVSELQLVGAR